MARHNRLVALATLAMVNVVTLVAGIAVASMLPARLDALKIPSVAPGRLAAVSPVLAPGGDVSPHIPSGSGLRAALTGPLSAAVLGPHVIAMVADPATGKVLLSAGGDQLATPASTTKVVTAVAALAALGGSARFTTRVVSPAPGIIVLVGGGDPTLAVNAYPSGDYPRPATLASLAAATADRLKASGRTSVRLGYDTSLYSGAGLAPGWPDGYVTTGNTTQIVSLEVDQGRLTSHGTPEDVDDPYNLTPRAPHPAAMAAAAFASLLTADGITVTGQPAEQSAAQGATPARGAPLASVSSPPLSAIVEQMLTESNNVIADNLARQVAIATGRPATFQGGADAETAVIRRLGVGTPLQLVDGSGLSPQDGIAPVTLIRVLEVAINRPQLRSALASLPVAGFSGTLAGGESVFAGIGGSALGVVRAKTGNLGSVTTLAGLVDDKDGTLLAFAFMADKVTNLDQAATAIDAAATNLAACGCSLSLRPQATPNNWQSRFGGSAWTRPAPAGARRLGRHGGNRRPRGGNRRVRSPTLVCLPSVSVSAETIPRQHRPKLLPPRVPPLVPPRRAATLIHRTSSLLRLGHQARTVAPGGRSRINNTSAGNSPSVLSHKSVLDI